MTFKCISIEDTKKLLEKDNVTIIDIRDFNSFSQGHVNNAMHVEDINIELFLKEKDKKVAKGKLNLILLNKIGSAFRTSKFENKNLSKSFK